jgi:hypothetical protein
MVPSPACRRVLQIAGAVALASAPTVANDGPPVTGPLPDFAGSKADQIRVVRCLKASVSNSGMDEGELPIANSRRPIASSQCRGPDFHLRRAIL